LPRCLSPLSMPAMRGAAPSGSARSLALRHTQANVLRATFAAQVAVNRRSSTRNGSGIRLSRVDARPSGAASSRTSDSSHRANGSCCCWAPGEGLTRACRIRTRRTLVTQEVVSTGPSDARQQSSYQHRPQANPAPSPVAQQEKLTFPAGSTAPGNRSC